jgi:putative membrane protein
VRFIEELAISWLTNAIVLALAALVLSGVTIDGFGALLASSALFGVLNTVLKPLLKALTLPLAFVTLGLIWFGVAMVMLALTALLIGGFHIHGFVDLFWATVIVWAANVIIDFFPGPWRRRKPA